MATNYRARRMSGLPHHHDPAQNPSPPVNMHAPQQPQMQPAAPTALTGYEPLDVIGNGTFGIIRKVRRLTDNQLFARKELNFERMSERDRKQIVAEVNILRTLGHDNIVKYEERFVDKDRGILYIVMEYCEGGDLGSVIKRYRRNDTFLQEETVWCYLAQMTRALDACHYRGVPAEPSRPTDDCSPLAHLIEINPPSTSDGTAAITAAAAAAAGSPHQSGLAVLHRDLKPENVFLDAFGNIKLGDFGLSKQVGTAELARTYVGTPYYMSPELATGSAYDAKSDIWALGCIVYELCAKRPPFDAANQAELTIKIKAGEVPQLPTQYSPELGKIVRAMLSLNPRHRPTTRQLLQIYQIQLCLKQLDVNSMARSLLAEREHLQLIQSRLESFEADLQKREAALQAAPTSIAESDRQVFAAQVADLNARELLLAQRAETVEAREAKVASDEIDAEKRRAELEKKYIEWYDGERKRAEEVLQENRERAEEIRSRRESREKARAARKSTATSSLSGDGAPSLRSGRGSGASDNLHSESLAQDATRDCATDRDQQVKDNVTTRNRRVPRASTALLSENPSSAAGLAEISCTTASRYINTTTQGGCGPTIPASISARHLRAAPSSMNVLPGRRVVSGPRASRISIAPGGITLGEQTTMMDIDNSFIPSHHMQVRERLFGGHPVNSPRSAMRVDTSARFHRPRPLSRVGGLLPGSGVDEVVVEMDQSPAPVSAARSVKASRVSRAHAEPDTLEEQDETEEDNGAATGGKALNSDGGNDEWIDQDAIESGGSGKASLSPPLLTSASSKAEAAGKGVDLRAWRGRTDDTEVEDDSEDAHDSATRNPRRNLNLCGFDSDVAMESPIVNKLRQDHRRSLMGLQSRRSAEVVQNVCAKDGMELDSPARVLGRDFGRMLLSEKTPPVAFPSAASSEQRSGSKDLHTESGSEVKSAASSSSAGASPALNASDEDLPSPFIKRVSRLESPPSSSAGTEQPGETSKYPIRSSSAHNLLAKAVAGSAAAAQKAANERRQGAGGLSKQSSASDLADDIENQRPGGVKSLYPPLPVSGQAVTSDRTSALQAIRARRQSVASGLVLGTSSIAPISLSSAPLKTAASSGTRPSATLARRLSAAAGAEPRAQASTLKSTGLKPVQPQGAPNSRVVTGTSIRGKMSSVSTAGGPNASRSSNAFPGRVLSSAAKPSTNSNVGSATTGFGGNNLLIPGASRRRSLMHSRDT